MKIAASLIAQVSLSTSMIEIENKRILELTSLMSKTISENYPLVSLVGNSMIYHQSIRGDFVSPSTVLHQSSLDYFNRLSPHVFKKGADMNSLMNTNVFKNTAIYVLYVLNSNQEVANPSGGFDEVLAIELKTDQ